MTNSDEKYMREALKEAQKAYNEGEVPIGAIIIGGGQILAKSHNLTESLNDPTAHAEMLAITSATNTIGAKYLKDCTLYVTLEPCPMCASALYLSQISRVVYGAKDDKRGYTTISNKLLHPKTEIIGGVLDVECGDLIKNFFKEKR